MRPGFISSASVNAWTPAQLANTIGWWQPDIGGPHGLTTVLDVASNPTRMSVVKDRLGKSLQLCRADGVTSGMTLFYGRSLGSGVVFSRRPCLGFDGSSVAIEITNAAITSGVTATDWTIGFRATPTALAGWMMGFNFSTANGIGLRADGVHIFDGTTDQSTGEVYVAGDQQAVVITKAANTIKIYTKNGTFTKTVVGSQLTMNGTTTSVLLGAAGNAAGGLYNGSIDELVMTSSPVSAADAATLLTYLRDPSGVMLLSAGTPLLVGIGNSNMLGSGTVTVGMIARIASILTTSVQQINLGISGQTTAQMLAAIATGGKPYSTNFAASGSQTYAIVGEFENDLQVTQNPAVSVANLESYCQQMQGFGAKVLTWTPPPMTGEGTNARYAGYDTDRLAAGVTLTAAAGTYCDGLAPVSTDPSVGPAPPVTGNTFYLGQGVSPNRFAWHFVDLSQLIVANLFKNKLAPIGLS